MPQGVHLSRLTPISFLERSAAAFPARLAVVDGERRLAWGVLRERVRRLAVALQESGLEKGDRVEFLASASDGEPEDRLESEDDTISINYTSGTTGRPKGVMYTYRGAYLNALAEAVHARLDSRSVYLWTLPMFHCNGWCFTWAVTAVGATHVWLRKVDPPLVWSLLEQEGVTHLNGAPTVLVMLTSDPAARHLER